MATGNGVRICVPPRSGITGSIGGATGMGPPDQARGDGIRVRLRGIGGSLQVGPATSVANLGRTERYCLFSTTMCGQSRLRAMKRAICAVIVALLGIGLRAQNTTEAHAPHGTCAEDNESVGYPLKGWIGYTNTGESVSEMMVQAITSLDKPPVATAKTDAAGRFSFPTISTGRYYLRARKKLVGETVSADTVVTVSRGNNRIACLVAETEATGESSPR